MFLQKYFTRAFSVIIILLIFVGPDLIAQADNPFELEDRLEQKVLAGERTAQFSDNPLDIQYTRPSGLSILKSTREDQLKRKFLAKKVRQTNLEFWICFFTVFIFAIGLSIYRNFVRMIFRSAFNVNLIHNLFRDRKFFNFPLQLFYLIYLINISFVVSIFYKSYYDVILDLSLFIKIFLSVLGLYLVKHILIAFTNFLVPLKGKIQEYNFILIIFGIILGTILLPLNVLYSLEYNGLNEYLIYLILASIGIIFSIRYLRGFQLFQQYLPLYFFQFFMYLCTLEIAPVLLIRNYFLSR